VPYTFLWHVDPRFTDARPTGAGAGQGV
jgi:hypothetical protein